MNQFPVKQEFHQLVKFRWMKSSAKSYFLTNYSCENIPRVQSSEFKDGLINLYRIFFLNLQSPVLPQTSPPPIFFCLVTISYIYTFVYSKLERKCREEREQTVCNQKTVLKNASRTTGNYNLQLQRFGGHDSEINLCTVSREILHSWSKACRSCCSDLPRESWAKAHHWSADTASWFSRESTRPTNHLAIKWYIFLLLFRNIIDTLWCQWLLHSGCDAVTKCFIVLRFSKVLNSNHKPPRTFEETVMCWK